ncbi:hypothetical protein EsDP_00004765 [Epichloe bromicola]|uniref:Galactosyl transferase GMA12/MNN10 family protein n=1 Tax=Epichloe bromicola TaxID=79588 RepID=A0ABQ0CSU1_9HYPO
MLEEKLQLLFWKGSLTSRARRTILVLVVLLVTLVSFQVFFTYGATRIDLEDYTLSRLGTHADVHDEQARVGKISILYGSPKRAYERALQSHKRHNRQHGYPMFVQRVDVLDGYWTKPAFIHYMILRELRKPESQRLQWLFWFDADTIILNYNIALEMFLPPDNDEALKDINVLISDDWNGLNNGIFGIRVSRSAAELFAGILAFRDFEPDTQLSFQDQSAMELMLKRRKFVNHVAKVPQRWFNAYESDEEKAGSSYFHAGDFLVHFAGVGNRDAHMDKWADRSEELSPKWNAPVAKTTYPAEIERFWNRTKSLHDARVNHWTKGAKHLTASIQKVNDTVTEWKKTSEKVSENLLSLVKAQETAEYFMGNSTKYGGEIIKDDLHQLDKVVLDLENAYRVFSDGSASEKAKLEEERKKKTEDEKKKEGKEKSNTVSES